MSDEDGFCDCESYDYCGGKCCGYGNCTCTVVVCPECGHKVFTAVAAGAHLAKVVLDAAEAWREACRDPWTDETPERLRVTDNRLIAAVDAYVAVADGAP